MPRAAVNTEPSLSETCRQIAVLLSSALSFVAPERGEAMVRKWLGRCDIDEMSEERMLAMTADAMLLSVDLLLSYPATSGTTALDRLARNRSGASAAEATAIDALCKARFRLLRLEGEVHRLEPLACDVTSDETLRIVGPDLPQLTTGTVLFGRVVMLGNGLCCLPGAITPLDAAAFALARGHAVAGAPGVMTARALGGGGIWPCSAARDAGRSRLEPAGW